MQADLGESERLLLTIHNPSFIPVSEEFLEGRVFTEEDISETSHVAANLEIEALQAETLQLTEGRAPLHTATQQAQVVWTNAFYHRKIAQELRRRHNLSTECRVVQRRLVQDQIDDFHSDINTRELALQAIDTLCEGTAETLLRGRHHTLRIASLRLINREFERVKEQIDNPATEEQDSNCEAKPTTRPHLENPWPDEAELAERERLWDLIDAENQDQGQDPPAARTQGNPRCTYSGRQNQCEGDPSLLLVRHIRYENGVRSVGRTYCARCWAFLQATFHRLGILLPYELTDATTSTANQF